MFESLKPILLYLVNFIVTIDPVKMIFILFGLGIWMYLKHTRRHHKSLNWTDLITDKGSNKVSTVKLLQILGGITATLVVIYETLHDKLGNDIFFTYLTYTASINMWSTFVAAKFNVAAPQIAEITKIAADQNKDPPAT